MSDHVDLDTDAQWLSDDDLETVRGRVPMVYVDAVPVRVDSIGEVTHITEGESVSATWVT